MILWWFQCARGEEKNGSHDSNLVIFSPTPAPARRRFVAPASLLPNLQGGSDSAQHIFTGMDSAGQTTSYVFLLMREQPTTLEDYIYHLGSTTLRWRCPAAYVLAYKAYNLSTRSAYCYRNFSIDDALPDRRLAVADTSRLCAAACTFSFFAKPYDAHI